MQAFACGVLFDLGRGPAIDEECPEFIAVVGGISEQGFCGRQRFDEPAGGTDIVTVTLGQVERDYSAAGIHDGVDFRGSPAAAAADRLLLCHPFPPAAQR